MGGAAALQGGIATIRRVVTGEKLVALAFDDGPEPALTPAKLATLAQASAQATFFALGKLVDARPDLVGQIVAQGSEVGNHTYDHPHLTGLGYAQIVAQIDRAKEAVRAAGGGFAPLFRPPYGEFDDRVLQAAAQEGYLWNVLWNVDPSDYLRPSADLIASRVVTAVIPGSIVVLHDWVPETAQALPSILAQLASRGYRAVTLSVLLGGEEPAPPPGPRQCRTLRVQSPLLAGDDVFAVQRALAARNLDPGPVDGIYGTFTSAAVRRFQDREGLLVTGVVTADEYVRLGIQCPSLPPPPPPGPGPSRCRTLGVQSPYLEGDDVLAIQEALRARGFDPGPLDGIYGPQTAQAVRSFQTGQGLTVSGVVTGEEYRRLGINCPAFPPGPTPPPGPGPSQCRTLRVSSPYLRGDDVLAVQRALGGRGIDPGPFDGIYGPRTAGAVATFQARRGLPSTGVVTATEYQHLGITCP